MQIDQLTTANTFEEWLSTTSALIAVANNLTDNTYGGFLANSSISIEGNGASLNVRTHANINTLTANTGNIANTSLEKSNVTVALDLSVGMNLSSNTIYANDVYAYGIIVNPNASFNQANSQFIQSNAAFDYANSNFIKSNSTFDHANSNFIKANAAFDYANSNFIKSNAAFDHANSNFIKANSAFDHANASFSNANGAFAAANAAYIQANSEFIKANSLFIHTNSEFIQANSLFIHANSEFIQTNALFNHANASFNTANAAFIRANNSLDANNGGTVTGPLTIRSSSGLKSLQSSTQDSVTIKGRSGGSGSYSVSLVPDTLDSDKTVTLSNESFTVGFRGVLPAGQKTSAYTLTANDVAKFVRIGSGGSINIPDNTFSEGDILTIFNDTSSNVKITYAISVAYLAGIDGTISSANVPTKGVATVMFIDPNTCVSSGILQYV